MTEEKIREYGFKFNHIKFELEHHLLSTDFLREISDQITIDKKSDVELNLILELCSKFKHCSKEYKQNIKNMIHGCWTWRDEDLHDELYNTLRGEE